MILADMGKNSVTTPVATLARESTQKINDRATKGCLVARWLKDENGKLYCRWDLE